MVAGSGINDIYILVIPWFEASLKVYTSISSEAPGLKYQHRQWRLEDGRKV